MLSQNYTLNMHIWFSHFKKLNSSKHVTFPAESEVRYVQATVVCSSPFWLCSTYSRTLHIDFPSNWSQSSQREWQRRTPPFLYNLSHQKRSRVIFLVQLQHNTSRMFPTLFSVLHFEVICYVHWIAGENTTEAV